MAVQSRAESAISVHPEGHIALELAGREEMDEKDQQIAHFRIVARNQKLAEFPPNQQFGMDTCCS
jgi:hypothetical protein